MDRKKNRATSIIERAEREGGGCFDDLNVNTMNILLGAMAREMGISKHQKRDDLAAGLLIKGQIENPPCPEEDAVLVNLLVNGVSPDQVKTLHDALHGKEERSGQEKD